MVFHWSLSDSKSPQVSRTLLSILAFLNNAIVWTVSTRPPTSKSSISFNNPLVIVPNAPITIDIIVTFMFHSFFQFPWGTYRSLRFLSVLFCSQPGQQIPQFWKFPIFLYFTIWPDLVTKIRRFISMSKSHRSLCVSFSRAGAGLCIYHLFVCQI